MSIDRMSAVWKQSKHKGSALLLMLAIADNASDNGLAWPGVPNLAKRVRVGERALKDLIKECEGSGELTVYRRKGRYNHYIINVGLTQKQRTDAIKDLAEKLGTSAVEITSSIDELVQPSSPVLVNPRSPESSLEPSIEPTTDTPNGGQQVDPKPPTLQQLLFGVFKEVLGMAPDAEVPVDSMIGRYTSWLSGNEVKKHRKSDELVPGCNPPCTPEEARAFLKTWVIERKLNLSPDTVTFADNFYGTRPTLQVVKIVNLDAGGGDPLFDPDFANLSPVEAHELALKKQLAALEKLEKSA